MALGGGIHTILFTGKHLTPIKYVRTKHTNLLLKSVAVANKIPINNVKRNTATEINRIQQQLSRYAK